MDTEAEAFAASAQVENGAARERELRQQIEGLHQEVARLAARPSAARVLMDTLENVCPWLWREVVGSPLDPCFGAADPAKVSALFRAVLDRVAGGPPMDAETWQVVCVGRRSPQEERVFVDVRTRRTREFRYEPGIYVASARCGSGRPWSWSTVGVEASGDDPRVLCSVIAGRMALAVVRILSPEQIAAEGAT